MRRLIFGLLGLLMAVPVAAQPIGVNPATLAPPVIVFPASAVNGAGVMTIPLQLPDGSAGAPSSTYTLEQTSGWFRAGTNDVRLAVAGVSVLGGSGSSVTLYNGRSLAFGTNAFLIDDAANTLAQRNGTNAQTWRLYNTYTDASNNEYGEIGWSFTANRFSIMAKQTGTGTARILQLGTSGSAAISFLTANTAQFSLSTGGALTGSNPTGGLGYGTGAGGAVSQATSRTTGVTLNTVSGDITLFSAAGSATATSFTVTDSAVAATDTVIPTVKSATNKYLVFVTATAAGSFEITFYTTGGTATDAPVFHFSVVKGANS